MNFRSHLQQLDNKFRYELADRDSITEPAIDNFVNTYATEVKNNTWQQGGWAERNTTYNVSKVAANAYVTLKGRTFASRPDGQKIYINSFCPGFTKTDMTEGKGSEDIAGAVQTGVWLALHPAGGPSGKFWTDCKEHSW
jgi:carbonyl reductase 1